MKYCTNCGAQVEDEQNVCTSCGSEGPFNSSDASPTQDTVVVTNAATGEELAAKLEDDIEHSIENPLTPEEMAEFDEQQRLNLERRQRQFARVHLSRYNSLSDNYFLGFVGALLGGLVGAIPWAIVSCMGWFVAWLGYVIAIAASKGYDLMKVKVSMKKIWFVAISVVVGVFAGQIMSDLLYFAVKTKFNGAYISYVFSYIFDNFGEYLSINAANLALGLVFAALGGFSVLKTIKHETNIIKELKEKFPEEDIM